MADETAQGAGARVAATWRTPLETTALVLLGAVGFSIVGGIVNAVFTPGANAWRKLTFLGFNVVSIWHVAVLAVVVGLVLALRIPFEPEARGAETARAVLLGSVVVGGVIVLSAVIASVGALGNNERFVGFSWPEKIGYIMQWLGGAAVAAAVALLAWRAQSLLPARVRPARTAAPPPAPAATTATTPTAPSAPPTAPPVAAGWAADPYGRHQWRYWDGSHWTDQVADGSTQTIDPAR